MGAVILEFPEVSGKRNHEEMASMFQTLAAQSQMLYERAMAADKFLLAAFYQRQRAKDFHVAWEYLQGAINRKGYYKCG